MDHIAVYHTFCSLGYSTKSVRLLKCHQFHQYNWCAVFRSQVTPISNFKSANLGVGMNKLFKLYDNKNKLPYFPFFSIFFFVLFLGCLSF